MKRTFFCLILLCFLFNEGFAEQFFVTSNADAGSGTLRDAIKKAALNGDAQNDQILFNISGVTLITLETELPALSSNISIDGTSQPGPGQGATNVKITLIRASTLYFHGLAADKVNDVKIFGIKFVNFKSDQANGIPVKKGAIYLNEAINIRIGDIDKENIFVNNSIAIYSPVDVGIVENVSISANLIGIEADGSVVPNDNGIDLSYPKNSLIGGPTRLHGNVVSGNINQAIGCGGAQGTITIQNNLIGVDRNVSKVYESSKGTGIYANGPGAVIYIFDNVVGGQETGILLDNVNNHFRITGNYVGTGFATTENFKNSFYGIKIFNCINGGIIGGGPASEKNYIANNDYGIFIERNSVPVSISRNSIFCNRIRGIEFKDLPATPETPRIGTITTSTASGTYLPNSIIELFYDDNCPNCEGKTYLTTVMSDNNGSWRYEGAISGNLVATGTAGGATSGFSSPVLDQSRLQIMPSFCEAGNGSIRNVEVSDASVFNWYNANGQLVGNQKDLLNVPPGNYQLLAGQPNGCFLKTPYYTVAARQLNFEVSSSEVKPSTCGENNGAITITGFKTDTPVEFRWLDKEGTLIATTRDVTGLPVGTYTLLASNGNGCENLAGTFNIIRVDATAINVSEIMVTSNCDNSQVGVTGIRYEDPNGPHTYRWRDKDGNEVGDNIGLGKVSPGSYSLTITNKFNCSVSTGLIDLTRIANRQIITPSAFTPNSDGVNDIWNITGAENYPDGQFKVYNRYGQEVFSSRGYSSPFNGSKDGRELPVGAYYFILTLNPSCPPLTGSVSIIR